MSKMIVLDCKQGTAEWLKARVGVPTASMFGSIITPGGISSTARKDYLMQLAMEWVIGKPDPDAFQGSYWMKRGHELEPAARAFYEFWTESKVTEAGFVYKNSLRQVGCSPDGLIGDEGGWECKSPKLITHGGYLKAGVMPGIYKPQVQGCMYITERKWWDWMTYHPDTEPLIVRVERDNDYIAKMDKLIKAFLIDLKLLKSELEGWKL